FDLDEFRRTCLLEGLDNIALTLKYEEQIKAYEKNSKSFLV
ncbi:3-isopropylmalate dehydratase small subunit, partial [Campylobacter coli]|nr:3-isopropylmalate dehydratase small subunit [Campylobacter coli]